MRLAERGRWVLLHHEVPPSNTPLGRRGTHWDLMIENAGALWTWAIQSFPLAARLLLSDCLIIEFAISIMRGPFRTEEGPSQESLAVSFNDPATFRKTCFALRSVGRTQNQ